MRSPRSVLEVPDDTLALWLPVYFDGDTAYQLTPPAVTLPRARLPALEAVRSKLPARVRGRNTSFDAIAAGGAWAALRDPTIAVSGIGPLPERLVLDRIGPDDVRSSFPE